MIPMITLKLLGIIFLIFSLWYALINTQIACPIKFILKNTLLNNKRKKFS
jgi:hypothetical protein